MSTTSPNHPARDGPAPQAAASAATPDPGVHAAIDIGTNSVHLIVARGTPGGRFEVLAQEKEVVRLGHGTGDMTRLAADAMDRGIAALDRFRQVADIWDAGITAVATSAVREAHNHDEFVRRAKEEAGIDVEIISGVEEARLIHLGVVHALPLYDQRCLVIDIGGGSTELVVGRNESVLTARSLKLGAIRLTDRFFDDQVVAPSHVDDCRKFVRAFIEPAVHDIAAVGFEVAAGSSGTIETLAAMVLAARGDDPTRPLNNVAVSGGELREVVERIVVTPTSSQRAGLPGMDSRRADIIVGGAIILEQIIAALGVDELRISAFALREGVLLDRLQHGGSMDHLVDLRRASVVHLAQGLDPDREHSEHVTELALRLFDQLRAVHRLDDRYRELLEAAGLLHNIGLFVNHAAHHKHSHYLIRNSEQMLGFTDHEIELIALVARYHRKSAPRRKHPEFAALGRDDQQAVTVLAGILRIAIGLDRTYSSAISDLAVDLDTDRGQVTIRVSGLADGDTSLEIYAADQRKGLLAETLGFDIAITPQPAETLPGG